MSLVPVLTPTTSIETELLLATFLLCSVIGLERQFRLKSAGYRTHVLVGLGACSFTIVSGFGFSLVLGQEVTLDPSRIAAQVVSGIGFLGAGVIFKGRDVVRGLTTAATIWQSAAIGMACGAGMLSLAILLTVLHLVTLCVVAPLVRRIPNADRKRVLRVTYVDGQGVLRDILAAASSMSFATTIERSRRRSVESRPAIVMDIRFLGRRPVRDLMASLTQLDGVEDIVLRDAAQDDDGDGD